MGIEGVAANEEFTVPENEEFIVRPEDKFFSKEFTILKKDWPVIVISTNKYAYSFFRFFDWRTHYTVCDSQSGEVLAHAVKNYGFTPRGIWNLSFLGWLRPQTLSDFDLYDGKGNYIGFIDGCLFDVSKARFNFQDKKGNVVAYARQENTQIMIKDIKKDAPLGFMQRVFDTGTEDTWKLAVSGGLDRRLALVFAAYVVQNQSYFLKDI